MMRLREYGHKCHILRQIMSNKAHKYRRINAFQSIATVVVSSFLLFIGFSGPDRIQTYLNQVFHAREVQVDFAFNGLVFLLFILMTLHLVFQFGRKQSDAERAVVTLSNLANQVDDLLSREELGAAPITLAELDLIRQKYETTLQILPPNSDREFLKAKRDFVEKERKEVLQAVHAQGLFDESQRNQMLRSVVRRSKDTMEILRALQSTDAKLYLGGGIIRNLVWDFLHGFSTPTPADDVDVVYFDQLSATKAHDHQIEETLSKRIPNLRWSVKNQARMHTANEEAPYTSLEDALSKWPETATAFAVRLADDGQVEAIAPHGLSDLFRLLVRPTPHFLARAARVHERASSKRWKEIWPKLELMIPDVTEARAAQQRAPADPPSEGG